GSQSCHAQHQCWGRTCSLVVWAGEGFWRAMEEGEEWMQVEDGASCGLEQRGEEKEREGNGEKVGDDMDVDVLEQEHDEPKSEDEEAHKIPVKPSLQLPQPKRKPLLVPMEEEELVPVGEQPTLLLSPLRPPPMSPKPEMEEHPAPAPPPAARLPLSAACTPTPTSAHFRTPPPPAHFPTPPPLAWSTTLPLSAQFPAPPPPLARSPTSLPLMYSPMLPAPAPLACSPMPLPHAKK
ncbi:hypothetical protein H0H87_007141, partial [Tephrocybe sp. NHM501043]